MNLRFLRRELRHGRPQIITFVLCVALSIGALNGLNGFKRDAYESVYRESRAMHGGDLIIHSHYPFSDAILQKVEEIAGREEVEATFAYRFFSMARPAQKHDSERSLLTNIKSVEANYPLYGTIELASGRSFQEMLVPGAVVVSEEVLSRLQLAVGELLRIGAADFRIADSIAFDPSVSSSFFLLGPRVYLHSEDLEKVGLLGQTSRADYRMMLKVKDDPRLLKTIEADLNRLAGPGPAQVTTAGKARSGLKRFLDNLFFFLSFISIFTLLLSGIGMQSSLSALVQQKKRTIAITKAMGASRRFLFVHYLSFILLMGAVGSALGMAGGYLIKRILPLYLGDLLPVSQGGSFSLNDILEGTLLGLAVTLLFGLLPLVRLVDIRPVILLRDEAGESGRKALAWFTTLVGIGLLCLLVINQLEDVRIGVYVILACLAVILIITLAALGLLKYFRTVKIAHLGLRQAQRSLFRVGNRTLSVVVTLACSLSVLLSIYLLEVNLFSSFITSYPKDAPNLFFLDIQQDQKDRFKAIVEGEMQLYPVIRARLLSINQEPIDYEKERTRKRDNLAREFNLTYRSSLLEDESIVEGGALFDEKRVVPPLVEVSLLDTIAEFGDIKRGDRLVFNIQGVELEALVTTIRSRTKSKLHPFFYFVFSEEVLNGAPQTYFGALHLAADDIAPTIDQVVRELPNVSAINVSETADRFAELLTRLADSVIFFSSFSMAAGCLILVGALMATRLARIREAAYYKMLGADSGFVLRMVVYEHILLSLVCSLIGFACAIGTSWIICRTVFEIGYLVPYRDLLVIFGGTLLVVTLIGSVGSLNVIHRRPIDFLRQDEGG
jgi:putative ABC transport system permease protein